MEFPLSLLRLPQLTHERILVHLSFQEQLHIALCSRRAHAIVKSFRHQRKDVELWLRHNDRIDLCTGTYRTLNDRRTFSTLLGANRKIWNSVPKTTVSINGRQVPAQIVERDGSVYVETYWETRYDGIMTIADFIFDLFRMKLTTIILWSDHRMMFDWIQNRQDSIDTIYINERHLIRDEDFRHIILTSNTKQILGKCVPSAFFEIPGFSKKLERFALNNSFWITLSNLMTMDCVQIEVTERWFSNKEVNLFLEHWVNGGSPRLKYLSIWMKEMDEDWYLDGLREF